MPDRSEHPDDPGELTGRAGLSGLAGELRALGGRLDVPPAPDVTLAVRARLAGAPTPRPAGPARAPGPLRRRTGLRLALAVLLAVLTAVLAVPPVRAAVVDFFRIGGVSVRSEPGPAVPPTPASIARPVADLDEAVRLTGIRLRPPAALGPPDSVHVIEDRVVSARWVPTLDRPEVRLEAFDGRPEPTFEKYLRFRESEELRISPSLTGYYLPFPHEIVYVDSAGVSRTASARLSQSTLIWVRSGVTYRLEGDLPPDRLAALAAAV